MQKYAIIVAGGAGTRMGSAVPKQFMLLDGKPVLYHTLKAFLDVYPDLQTALVVPQAHMDAGKEIVDRYFNERPIKVVAGGRTRFHSVKNGLSIIKEESIVFVHDGVRCLVTADLITRCDEVALVEGTAIPVIPSRDSVRLLNEGDNRPLDRDKVMLVQTPQTFNSKILLAAFQREYQSHFTDEATVVEAYGTRISMVEGEEDNIKITRPIDLIIAEEILRLRRVSAD